jgi:photosystem II stability/assembly factor-like uncharacterized protein
MTNVILISVLGPPRLICGTNDTGDLSDWWNTTTPREYPGYICNRIKHLTGETFLAITHDAASSGYVLITRDAGHNWTTAHRFESNQPITLEVGNGYAFIGTGSGVYRSRDGITWTLLPGSPGSIQNFAVFPDGKLMGHNGARLYRSYNSGDSWEELHSPLRGAPFIWWDTLANPGSASFAIAGKSSSYIVASMGAALWLTTNFGTSWTKLIQWTSWYIPRELHFTRGNTFILKIRKLDPSVEEINMIAVSSDNCLSFVEKFNQDVTWEHQIEYIAPLDLILVGHTHYMEPYPFETWLDRFTPAIMYSRNNGVSFTEVVSPVFGRTFSIIAISGWVLEAHKGIYLMDITLKKTFAKTFRMGMRLACKPIKNYSMDIRIQGSLPKSYSMDMLLKKTVAIPYQAKIRIMKTVEKSHTMDITIAQRIGKPYTMSMILKKYGFAYYRMSCPKRKTVTTDYGMGISIVGDYTGPLKREVMLAFPQPFALEIENINYVLRQDITVERIDEHGY